MATRVGVYGGTFDPLTNGHLDIINRSVPSLCDHLVIGIGINPAKKPLFFDADRVRMIREVLDQTYPDHKGMFTVKTFSGLLAEFAQQEGANMLIRGIRSVSDFEYELNLANINLTLEPRIQSVFLPTRPQLAVVSSSMVKELAKHGADIFNFVPQAVAYEVYKVLKPS